MDLDEIQDLELRIVQRLYQISQTLDTMIEQVIDIKNQIDDFKDFTATLGWQGPDGKREPIPDLFNLF
jgi:hypothetical protein